MLYGGMTYFCVDNDTLNYINLNVNFYNCCAGDIMYTKNHFN